MTAEDFAKLVSTPILLPAGLAQAKTVVEVTSKDSPRLAEFQAELAEAQKRWDSEAPVREARELLRKAGWEKSHFDPKIWYNRKTKKKLPLIEAIIESKIAQ